MSTDGKTHGNGRSSAENIVCDLVAGPYRGFIAEQYGKVDFLTRLEDIPGLLNSSDTVVLYDDRNTTFAVRVSCGGVLHRLVIKRFGKQPLWKDLADRLTGTRAYRTWKTAEILVRGGVGTPRPVGFLEKRDGLKLVESYYISEYHEDLVSFRDELIRLFKDCADCGKFMAILKTVAEAVSSMHEAGVMHNDLGNQNIFLRRGEDGLWKDVWFLDLNRSGYFPALSARRRARDISRIYLPSDFLRVFKEMYYLGGRPSRSFQRWEKFYRRLYAVHSWTRTFRHPVREWKKKGGMQKDPVYPPEQDMWVWDPKSIQPVNVMRPACRRRYYRTGQYLEIASALLRGIRPVFCEYRQFMAEAYSAPVIMRGRTGLVLDPGFADGDRKMELMQDFPDIPVLMRFYAHESAGAWDRTAECMEALEARGHRISAAVVQDRASVQDPRKWRSFLDHVFDRVGMRAEWIELCHAVNRVKWGIWDLEEYRRLLDAAMVSAVRFGVTRLMGPAVIDFDCPFVMAALEKAPAGMRFGALSHHLYVDRRGAPENRQGPFSLLEKCALLKAIARYSEKCDERVIVSEVNWPLANTGVYSPVTAPYESPGPRSNDPSVSEDDYADYMLRYMLTALCSGMVERVYWWRLVARGFGLVDDTDAWHWRKRPAYRVFKCFSDAMADAVFIGKPAAGNGVNMFLFRKNDGARFIIGYSQAGWQTAPVPYWIQEAFNSQGDSVKVPWGGKVTGGPGDMVTFTGQPLYLALKE